jgi:hypothetical protein
MHKRFSFSILAAFALVLGGCGGGGEDEAFKTPTSPGGGGGGGGAAAVASLTLTTSTPTIPSDGSATATITAMVRDATNNLLPNVPVTITASSGGIAGSPATTGSDGSATVTLSTAGDPTLRTITVTGTAGGQTATVNVQVVAASGGNNVQLGSPAGAAFQPGIIQIGTPNLSAGGSTSLRVVLQHSDGTLYTQEATVNFSSTCQATGLATITSPVTTSTGIADTTYVASGCAGDDVITATANVNGASLSASGTVTVAAASIGSIVFESATPTNIALKGMGVTGRPETSTVVFRVLDQSGGPRPGVDVNFTLNTAVGGLSLTPATAQSDAQGRVQTVVQAGTVATSVRVTATVADTPAISTQSSALTVTTGIPDQNSFSLAVQCQNVEAWSTDGVTVPVTARLSDRFNNPVPDGTAVTFTTEGGTIQSQCTTTTTETESGVCVVNWTSSNPRPAAAHALDRAGRSTILATAIGEESFVDSNGNGTFDNGENFTDLAEQFLDEDEDGVYDAGIEPIYDFNSNSMHDPGDNAFNGVLCTDTTGRCGPTTIGIGASNLIIMSHGEPRGVDPPNNTVLPPVSKGDGARTYSFVFADLNDNPLPAQTTISASIAGTGLSISAPSNFTVPCTTEPTVYSFTVTVSNDAQVNVNRTMTITVTSPGGLTTPLTYTVPVDP